MIRVLSMIALAGFFLSLVCLSAAVALGGPELVTSAAWGWTGRGLSVHWDHDQTSPYTGESARRELPWKGGETLVVSVPADVRFTQAQGPATLVVRGPKDALDRLDLRGGWIQPMDARDAAKPYQDVGITIELTAPKVTTFQLTSGKLEIRDYNQDRLQLNLFGSGDAKAAGTARRVDLKVGGSGDADLRDLSTDEAAVSVQGSGGATLAPRRWAKVDVSGSGDVRLTRKPAQLQTQVTGSGHITVDGEGGDSREPGPPEGDRA